MQEPSHKRRLTRPLLHRYEERIKYALRDQVAEVAGFLEVLISVLVLFGLLISTIPVAKEMVSLWLDGSTDAFQIFLGHAFNLVIGIEFIKMLAKHSPGSALEVLLYAIARNMILDHGTALDNLLGVLCIGLIFVIRKFCFVPSFGATMPGGEVASDLMKMFGKKKSDKAAKDKGDTESQMSVCSPEEGLEGPEPDITEMMQH